MSLRISELRFEKFLDIDSSHYRQKCFTIIAALENQ
jgi:hypothetical protein